MISPFPRTPLAIGILRILYGKMDKDGNFQPLPMMDVVHELIIDKTIQDIDEEIARAKRLITDLEQNNYLRKHGDGYVLDTNGHMEYQIIMGEKIHNADEEIEITSPHIRIEIDFPIVIFISCGDRPHEARIAKWLKERLEENGEHVVVHWWGDRSPGSMGGVGFSSKIQSNIESSDLFIGILHRRESLSQGKFYTSQATREEMIWAVAVAQLRYNKPFFCAFRQENVLLDGMMIPRHEVRKVKNSDEIVLFVRQALTEVKEYNEKFPLTEQIAMELKQIENNAIAGIQSEQYDIVKFQLELIEQKYPFHDPSFKGVSHRTLEEIANEASTSYPKCVGYFLEFYDRTAALYENVPELMNEKIVKHIQSVLSTIKYNLLTYHQKNEELIIQVNAILSRFSLIFKKNNETSLFNIFALIAKEEDPPRIFKIHRF